MISRGSSPPGDKVAKMIDAGRARALVVLLGAAAGCGLINADVTRLSFDLPTKTYTFDTAAWMLPATATGTVPAVPCATTADCCGLPGVDCGMTALACDDGRTCTLHKTVTVAQMVTLSQEVSTLHGVTSLASVYVSKIGYTVDSSLNIDLPPVTIYLAPAGVTDPNDQAAKKFGTVPATPAGTRPPAPGATGMVTLESDAQTTFGKYAQDLSTPFTFLATTTVTVPAGSPIPSGKVTVSVTGQISAQARF
jgi:hypothetical protein